MSTKELKAAIQSFEGATWLTREQVAQVCPTCATKMASLGIRKVRASVLFSDDRFLTAASDAWKDLPKGWTQESLKSFWDSLGGKNKHKITACIQKIKGSEGIDDPGAFCASLARRMVK